MANNNISAPSSVPWWQILAVGRNLRVTLLRAVVLVVLCAVTFTLILIPMRVTGISMEPTYLDNQKNFINRSAYYFSQPRRGDVVGIRTTGLRVMYLKRIVALPGETFRMQRGVVYINGEPLDEPYLGKRSRWNHPETALDVDEYLVIGDNRTMPKDHHVFRIVPRERIVGRILW